MRSSRWARELDPRAIADATATEESESVSSLTDPTEAWRSNEFSLLTLRDRESTSGVGGSGMVVGSDGDGTAGEPEARAGLGALVGSERGLCAPTVARVRSPTVGDDGATPSFSRLRKARPAEMPAGESEARVTTVTPCLERLLMVSGAGELMMLQALVGSLVLVRGWCGWLASAGLVGPRKGARPAASTDLMLFGFFFACVLVWMYFFQSKSIFAVVCFFFLAVFCNFLGV